MSAQYWIRWGDRYGWTGYVGAIGSKELYPITGWHSWHIEHILTWCGSVDVTILPAKNTRPRPFQDIRAPPIAVARPSSEVIPMPKFRINFRVEQTLDGSIEVEAADVQSAAAAFKLDAYEDQRRAADLDLGESEDSIVEIVPLL